MYFDASSIKNSSAGGSKFWFLFVDEATGHKKSYFGPAKKSLVKAGEKYVRWLRREGIEVTAFRCDDGGENKNFERKITSQPGWSIRERLHLNTTV